MKRDKSLIVEIKQLPEEIGQSFANLKSEFALLAEERKSDIIWL